ncbi:MAG: type II toxin-antitoxin system Phd/YefM family antitoxin [Bauldia sp.]
MADETVTIAEAEARFDALIELVEAGRTVRITRDGAVVALLAPPVTTQKPIDLAALKAVTDKQPMAPEGSAARLVRWMRNADRC